MSSEAIGRSSKTIFERNNEYSDEEDEPLKPRIQSLRDIYNSTHEIHVICMLIGAKDL